MKNNIFILGAICIVFSLMTLLVIYLFKENFIFCTLLVIIFQLFLIHYLYRREINIISRMQRMISSIEFSDFTFSPVPVKENHQFKELNYQMEYALRTFRKHQYEQEIKHIYYHSLLRSVDYAILIMDKEGNFEWINDVAYEMLASRKLERVEDLRLIHFSFPEKIKKATPGKIQVIHMERPDMSVYDLAMTVTHFSSSEKTLQMISLKNIHSVLEENEIEAWQKLIRILTHEIMNSIAPIISLSETVIERTENINNISDNDNEIMHQAMQVIHRRSKGLLDFVDNYRKLTRIPVPTLTEVMIEDLFGDLASLFHNTNENITFQIENPGIYLFIDRSQIEQVLINLIKNAREALSDREDSQIKVRAFLNPAFRHVQISVTDNGQGILPEALDKIFVPFYTTKPTGSGIGLSVCKQIMNLHGGNISVNSELERGSSFILRFYNYTQN